MDGMHCCFPYDYTDGRVYALVEAVILVLKRDFSWTIGSDKNLAAQADIWAVHSADFCSIPDSVTYRCPPSRADIEVSHPSPNWQGVVDAYDVDVEYNCD